ncbi:hypothetical protein ACFUN8_09045 [Streptomyces sp. NPDC057307]|uniref:hypothetical protein n=1 Tax=Streptomyces sp. NPDC057307 TaxID=3346096 RepID=UPI00362910A7
MRGARRGEPDAFGLAGHTQRAAAFVMPRSRSRSRAMGRGSTVLSSFRPAWPPSSLKSLSSGPRSFSASAARSLMGRHPSRGSLVSAPDTCLASASASRAGEAGVAVRISAAERAPSTAPRKRERRGE